MDGPRPSISGSPPELFLIGMQLELHAQEFVDWPRGTAQDEDYEWEHPGD